MMVSKPKTQMHPPSSDTFSFKAPFPASSSSSMTSSLSSLTSPSSLLTASLSSPALLGASTSPSLPSSLTSGTTGAGAGPSMKQRRTSLALPSSPRVVPASTWSFRDDTDVESHVAETQTVSASGATQSFGALFGTQGDLFSEGDLICRGRTGRAEIETDRSREDGDKKSCLMPEKRGKLRKIAAERDDVESPSQGEKKTRKKWSKEETQMLVDGCNKHGVGNWKIILSDPLLKFDNRSPVDLKDRFRTYFPDAYKQHYPNARTHLSSSTSRRGGGSSSHPSTSFLPNGTPLFSKTRSKKRRPFSPEEDRALREGYEKHGTVWAVIVKDKVFEEQGRKSTDLRDRFRNAFPELYEKAGYKPRPAGKKKREAEAAAAAATAAEADATNPNDVSSTSTPGASSSTSTFLTLPASMNSNSSPASRRRNSRLSASVSISTSFSPSATATSSASKAKMPIRAATDDQLAMSSTGLTGPIRRRRRNTTQGLFRGGTRSVPQSNQGSEDEGVGSEDATQDDDDDGDDFDFEFDGEDADKDRDRDRNREKDDGAVVTRPPRRAQRSISNPLSSFSPFAPNSNPNLNASSSFDFPSSFSSPVKSTLGIGGNDDDEDMMDVLDASQSQSQSQSQTWSSELVVGVGTPSGTAMGGMGSMIGKSAWGTQDWFSPNPRLDNSNYSINAGAGTSENRPSTSTSSSYLDGLDGSGLGLEGLEGLDGGLSLSPSPPSPSPFSSPFSPFTPFSPFSSPFSPFSYQNINHNQGVFDRYDLVPGSNPHDGSNGHNSMFWGMSMSDAGVGDTNGWGDSQSTSAFSNDFGEVQSLDGVGMGGGSMTGGGWRGFTHHSDYAGDLIFSARSHQPQGSGGYLYPSGPGSNAPSTNVGGGANAGNPTSGADSSMGLGLGLGLGLSGVSLSQSSGVHPLQLHTPALPGIDEIELTGITLEDQRPTKESGTSGEAKDRHSGGDDDVGIMDMDLDAPSPSATVPVASSSSSRQPNTPLQTRTRSFKDPLEGEERRYQRERERHHQRSQSVMSDFVSHSRFTFDDLVDMPHDADQDKDTADGQDENEQHVSPPTTPTSTPLTRNRPLRPLRKRSVNYGQGGYSHHNHFPSTHGRSISVPPVDRTGTASGMGAGSVSGGAGSESYANSPSRPSQLLHSNSQPSEMRPPPTPVPSLYRSASDTQSHLQSQGQSMTFDSTSTSQPHLQHLPSSSPRPLSRLSILPNPIIANPPTFSSLFHASLASQSNLNGNFDMFDSHDSHDVPFLDMHYGSMGTMPPPPIDESARQALDLAQSSASTMSMTMGGGPSIASTASALGFGSVSGYETATGSGRRTLGAGTAGRFASVGHTFGSGEGVKEGRVSSSMNPLNLSATSSPLGSATVAPLSPPPPPGLSALGRSHTITSHSGLSQRSRLPKTHANSGHGTHNHVQRGQNSPAYTSHQRGQSVQNAVCPQDLILKSDTRSDNKRKRASWDGAHTYT